MRRRNIIVAIVALAVIIAVGAFAAKRSPAPVAVREFTVREGALLTKLPETGVLQLPRVATIPAGVAGNVASIEVRAGEHVSAGTLLATLANPQLTSNLQTAIDAVASARGHTQTISEQNAVLPEQNRSAIVQAEAAIVAARSQLSQARQDLVAGSQSGLGYGGQTAQEQTLGADTALEKSRTDLAEARRTYDANEYLFSNKAISNDTLMQSKARYDVAKSTFDQAKSERSILGGTLSRNTQVLRDRVRSAQDGLRQAEAALAAANANASQSKAGDLTSARADTAKSENDVAYAQDQVAHLRVVAPFDGIVESVASQATDSLRPLQPGDAIVAGQALFTMAANDRFVVRTRVDEQDIANVRVGQHAIVGGEDFGKRTLPGHVVAISPIAQKSDDPTNTSRQIITTIALDEQLPFLRDGMSVDVDIVTRDVPRVLAVPTEAVHQDDTGTYVFAVRDGRATRIDVATGAQNDSSIVVKSGLHPGDVIVAEKNAAVVANAPVTPAPSSTPAAAGS